MTTITLDRDEMEAWDRFAAAALCGFKSSDSEYDGITTIPETLPTIAEFADAMILERRKRCPSPSSAGPFPIAPVGHPCEKCGESKVSVKYIPYEVMSCVDGHPEGEHHHVTCTRCGATWVEAVRGQEKRNG